MTTSTKDRAREVRRKRNALPKTRQRSHSLRFMADNISKTVRVLERWPATPEGHVDMGSVIEDIKQSITLLQNAASDLDTLPTDFPPKRSGRVQAGSKGIEVGSIVRVKSKFRDKYRGLITSMDHLEVIGVVGTNIRWRELDGRTGFCHRHRIELVPEGGGGIDLEDEDVE